MTAIRKLIYFVAFAVAAVFVANVITISLGKASTSTVVETAITGIVILFFAGDYLRHAVSGIPFPKANHAETPGNARDDRLDTLDGQIDDLQSELREANSKIEAQQEEISDLRSELESADSEVKETCRKIDEALEGIEPGEPGEPAPDFFVPKIYETSPDGKLVHAYDLPPEPDRKSALAAVAASIDARANEGNPLHEPKAVIAKAYSAKTIEDSIG